jgi:chromosome segregation ATPase
MRRLFTATGIIIAFLTLGCSEPPTKERKQAEEALAAARAAGAETYAPERLQAAEAALQKYDGAVAQRDYREALNFALDARDGAYAAASRATTEKAAASGRANSQIEELEELMKTANARLTGTGAPGPRLSSQAAERLRAALRSAPVALQEARARIDQQDYRGAVLRLTPVIEAFQRELSASDAAAGRRGRG